MTVIMYNWRTGHARLSESSEAAPKLHNYNSARNKNSDTQKIHIHNAHKNIHTPLN